MESRSEQPDNAQMVVPQAAINMLTRLFDDQLKEQDKVIEGCRVDIQKCLDEITDSELRIHQLRQEIQNQEAKVAAEQKKIIEYRGKKIVSEQIKKAIQTTKEEQLRLFVPQIVHQIPQAQPVPQPQSVEQVVQPVARVPRHLQEEEKAVPPPQQSGRFGFVDESEKSFVRQSASQESSLSEISNIRLHSDSGDINEEVLERILNRDIPQDMQDDSASDSVEHGDSPQDVQQNIIGKIYLRSRTVRVQDPVQLKKNKAIQKKKRCTKHMPPRDQFDRSTKRGGHGDREEFNMLI